MKEYTPHIRAGKHLTHEQAHGAFDQILSGNVEENEISEFLLALKDKGEVASEILGAARVLRAKARKNAIPSNVLDVCGTGGDNLNTLNVSTAVAFVLAAAGVPVAKHGGKAVSSKSGSADVLRELGVNITNYDKADHCFKQSNMCFMFSPDYHETMKYVASIRAKLKTRTIFNILGPLLNPAQATRQLIGVYDARLLRVFAEVLRELGTLKAWIVHGADGLDELSISGETHVVELENGTIDNFTVKPEDAGLKRHNISEISGGDAKYNALAMVELFKGKKNAYREIVLLNAAAGLIVAGKVYNLQQGVQLASEAIDSGKAMQVLEKLREITK